MEGKDLNEVMEELFHKGVSLEELADAKFLEDEIIGKFKLDHTVNIKTINFEKLTSLAQVLSRDFDLGKKRIRIVFDYDPEAVNMNVLFFTPDE